MSVQKFVNIATTNKDGMWKSVALSNLAATFSRNECNAALEQALPILQKAASDRLTHLRELGAPQVIISNQQKVVDKLSKGKHISVGALYTQLKKIGAASDAISAKS